MPSQVSLCEALSVGADITMASWIESTARRGMFGLPMRREMHMHVTTYVGYRRR
jgi:hypothetical protein